MLVHARGRLTDTVVLDAIGRAVGLESTNARLRADVEDRLAEIDAPRHRLAQAVEEQHRNLRLRLEHGLDPRLAELESALEVARARYPNELGRGPLDYVREARREVASLGSGFAPRGLDRGLAVAIKELAARSPIPVTAYAASDGPALASGRAALYFVCSEALSNVAKHARASAVTVRLSSADGHVTLAVSDDGISGADHRRGTGLQGLRDRLEEVCGTLSVESPPGAGTRLWASVPDRGCHQTP